MSAGKPILQVDDFSVSFSQGGRSTLCVDRISFDIKPRETVALVGDSDSLAGSKLYFEMRKDGKSIDPAPWFRR